MKSDGVATITHLQNVIFSILRPLACNFQEWSNLFLIQPFCIPLSSNNFACLKNQMIMWLLGYCPDIWRLPSKSISIKEIKDNDPYLHWKIASLLLIPHLKARKMCMLNGEAIHLLKVFNDWFHVWVFIDWKPAKCSRIKIKPLENLKIPNEITPTWISVALLNYNTNNCGGKVTKVYIIIFILEHAKMHEQVKSAMLL